MEDARLRETSELSFFQGPALRRHGFWHRFSRNRLAVFGMIFLPVVIILGLAAPLLTPYDPLEIDFSVTSQAPGADHWLGTDSLGRDLYTRLLFAFRPMLLVSFFTLATNLVVGVTLGLASGYIGGLVDWFVVRLVELFATLPWYLIAFLLLMILAPNLENLIIALCLTSWVETSRVIRGMVLKVREREYIEAAKALGIPHLRILRVHILPEIIPSLVWILTQGILQAVIAETTLSLIGLGVRLPDPSFGVMLLGGIGFGFLGVSLPLVIFILVMIGLQGLADGVRQAYALDFQV